MSIRTRRPRPTAEQLFFAPEPKDYIVKPPQPDPARANDPKHVEELVAAKTAWEKLAVFGEPSADGHPTALRWDKEAHDVAAQRYADRLKEVKLLFRPVLDDTYMDWPYELNDLELSEAQRLEQLRATNAHLPQHPCHQKGFRTSTYLRGDAALARKILRSSLIGAEGFDEFPNGVFLRGGAQPLSASIVSDYETNLDVALVNELVETIIRGHMMMIAVAAAFRSQGLTITESLL